MSFQPADDRALVGSELAGPLGRLTRLIVRTRQPPGHRLLIEFEGLGDLRRLELVRRVELVDPMIELVVNHWTPPKIWRSSWPALCV